MVRFNLSLDERGTFVEVEIIQHTIAPFGLIVMSLHFGKIFHGQLVRNLSDLALA